MVVLDPVVGGIGQFDLLGPEGDGDLGAMLREVTALMGIGRVGGDAHGQLQSPLDVNIGGRLVQVAEDAFCLGRVFVVDVVADRGSRSEGTLGQRPQSSPCALLGEVGPLDAQGRQLVRGQGEQFGELLGPGRLEAVCGSIVDLQEGHLGLAGLALLGGRLADFLDDLREGAADSRRFAPLSSCRQRSCRLASSNRSCWQA